MNTAPWWWWLWTVLAISFLIWDCRTAPQRRLASVPLLVIYGTGGLVALVITVVRWIR